MFALRGVSKLYDDAPALRKIDLEIQPAKTTVLIGPSGCGKSTILRLFAGLIRPDEGVVTFDGKPIEPANVLSIRQQIGYVIQEGGLFPHLSAGRNASLMARYLGWDAARIGTRIKELSHLVHLTPAMLDRMPTQLSGGERQRVGLMRALMLDPVVLLLDEPLGALDAIVRRELQEDLKRIFGQLGKTVVLVTHDLNEATYFGDEVVLLRAGQIVQKGSPHDLIDSPADEFVDRFIRAQIGILPESLR